MAEYSAQQGAQRYGDFDPHGDNVDSNASTLTTLTNVAGAAVSLALIAGLGVWGYQLVIRDVSGIPVVRAAQGEMRVKPEDPGGQLALHQGLSVNEVAGNGSAAGPTDQLRLAPTPIDLTEEDTPQPALTGSEVASLPQPAPVPDVAAALENGDIDGLVAQLTEGSEPIIAPQEEVVPEETQARTPDPNAPVPISLRPMTRPADLRPVDTAMAIAADVARSLPQEVAPADIPAGTRLVQLGAFDSPEVARKSWDRLGDEFGDFFRDKARVVQEAQSGGRTFYRLRAMGFADMADMRRFCSTLIAADAECIPVVTR